MKKIIILLSILLFNSCDVIDDPYDTDGSGIVLDTTGVPQNILIMEFTAIKCPNCPVASKKGSDLIKSYEGRVFGLNVHAGVLATPVGDQPDFRSAEATDLYKTAGNPPQPTAIINQLPDGINNNLLNYLSWEEEIIGLLNTKSKVELWVETEDLGDNNYKAYVKYIYGDNGFDDGDKVAIYLAESKIVGFQIDGREQLLDYEHNHVFRKPLLGTYGEEIDGTSVVPGDTLTKEVTFSLEDGWVPENINVLGLIYDAGGSFGIKQVNETHLINE